MFGKANTFAASVREGGRYVSSKRVGRERDEGGNTRTYRTPFVVRHVASCRRCKRRDEKGVRGIVGVGKLKAEAPRCRSGQPTPRCFARAKKRKEQKKRERKESEIARPRSRESAKALAIYVCFVFGRDRVSRMSNRTKGERRLDSHKTLNYTYTLISTYGLRVLGMCN